MVEKTVWDLPRPGGPITSRDGVMLFMTSWVRCWRNWNFWLMLNIGQRYKKVGDYTNL